MTNDNEQMEPEASDTPAGFDEVNVVPSKKQPSKLQQELNWYLSLFVIALLVILPPIWCGFLYLARVPDITWEGDDGISFDRIWMYRERRPVGIGYQSRRVIAEYSNEEVCAETRLRFFLWGSTDQAAPATTSQLMVLVDDRWQPTSEACP